MDHTRRICATLATACRTSCDKLAMRRKKVEDTKLDAITTATKTEEAAVEFMEAPR